MTLQNPQPPLFEEGFSPTEENEENSGEQKMVDLK
jgi:hypothetical protein